MEGFQKKKEKNEEWFSDPVYSHFGGYKMCLRVVANGYRDGKGNHVSVYVYLMQGDNNANLEWPFKGTIKVSLLNQLGDGQHLTEQVWSPDAKYLKMPVDVSQTNREQKEVEEYQDTPFTEISVAKVLRTSNS